MIPPWFQACRHQFQTSIIFYGSVIISRMDLKRSISQAFCVYFTTLVVAIHYSKWSVLDSRKFEGYIYLRRVMVALFF